MDDRLCTSLQHRVVLHLFRAAHGAKLYARDIEDIQYVRGDDLVRISAAHGIAPTIADGLERLDINELDIDRDLTIFFQEIREGNRFRNQKMKAQLTEAAAILSDADIRVVVLKGGCELALPSYQQVHKRFIGDLDLLIPKTALRQAVSVLESKGYFDAYQDDEFYNSPEHHDAPLINERWPAPVEIHQTIGGEQGEQLLPAEQIIHTAKETVISNLMVPSRVNRLIHLVLHQQVQHAGFQDRILSLRSLADMAALVVDEDHIVSARKPFEAAGLQTHFDGLLAATDLILPGLLPSIDHTQNAEQWASTAIERFGSPRSTSREFQTRRLKDWARDLATDPGRRSELIAKLFSAGGLQRMMDNLRSLRQR